MYCESTDHLMLPHEWKAKKRQLQEAGKKYDPKPLYDKRAKLTDNDEPPTLDSAPPEWHDKQAKKHKRNAKSVKKSDVFQIS
jgi:hypothetical protein